MHSSLWKRKLAWVSTAASVVFLVLATKDPSVAADSKPGAEDLAFFEKKIRPVLAEKCYRCHSADAEKLKGGLRLDTSDGIRAGGESGHAVVPGDVSASLLIKAIRYQDKELQMPPAKAGGKLAENVIADFEKWVRLGAPDPREVKSASSTPKAQRTDHWAFRSPEKAALPQVKDEHWSRQSFDRFILADLEAKGVRPVGEPEKRTLVRRVYFDLIGLPPTPEQAEAFVRDSSPKAFEKIVDALLASPQFGEKWGRHWLDVARYAESSGKENNISYPHAWRYRDYVIKSFNDDKPFDQFLKEQLAGDLLDCTNETQHAEQLVATGFLAIGPKSHNTRNPRQFEMDLADEQIDAVSQGMLGLTVACARCHDHKFDPIPTKDYYAMAGIFLSTETRFGTPRLPQNSQATPLIQLPEAADLVDAPPPPPLQLAMMKRRLEQAKRDREEILAAARASRERGVAAGNPRLLRATAEIAMLEAQLSRYGENGKPARLAMGVREKGLPRDARLLARGELDKAGESVPRGVIQIASTTKPKSAIRSGSGRRELADWVASAENPLTARVFVNRLWIHFFGQGLVTTPDNFGTAGQKPTHPALLDYLAVSFMEEGWSVKRMIRTLVLSHTYQLSSAYDAKSFSVDPDNIYHWRMSPRRLDAEAIRDAMLAVSGQLNLRAPPGSPVANTEGPVQALLRFGDLRQEQSCRSVYLPIVRDLVPDALAVFDFAEPSLIVGQREDTTVPAQALYLMNNPTVQKLAEAMAERLLSQRLRGASLAERAFQMTFARPPDQAELKAAREFFSQFNAAESSPGQNSPRVGRAGVVAFCQALLASAEFRYLH